MPLFLRRCQAQGINAGLNDGLAIFWQDNRHGFANTQGTIYSLGVSICQRVLSRACRCQKAWQMGHDWPNQQSGDTHHLRPCWCSVLMGLSEWYKINTTQARWLLIPNTKTPAFFWEGLATVRLGKKWDYIDKTGMVMIPFYLSKPSNLSRDKLKSVWTDSFYIHQQGQIISPKRPRNGTNRLGWLVYNNHF